MSQYVPLRNNRLQYTTQQYAKMSWHNVYFALESWRQQNKQKGKKQKQKHKEIKTKPLGKKICFFVTISKGG